MRVFDLNKAELMQENSMLSMLLDITNTIVNESHLHMVLKRCLSIICIGLQCPIGHIYFVDEEKEGVLTPSELWFIKDPEKTPAFQDFTMKTVVKYCEDIVGRVLASGVPCFIDDVCQDTNFLRVQACQLDNLHGAMAFPVRMGEKIVFVIELFTHECKKHNAHTLLLLNRLSNHLTHYLVYKNNMDEYKKRISQLKYAVGSGKVGIWEYNPRNGGVHWDEQMYLMYGVVPHDFGDDYKSWEETLHPDDKERTATAFEDAITKHKKFSADFRIITPTGDIRYIHSTAIVKYSADGRAESVFGINTDITKEKNLVLDLSKKTDELEEMNNNLKKHAYFDALTGLMNRNSLKDSASRNLARCKRNKSTLAVLFIDLDDFKKINDSLGHSVGDLVLAETAKRLTLIARKEDIIARVGGDEFIEVIELKDTLLGTKQANRIMGIFNKPFQINSSTIQINASIGIAYYPAHGSTFNVLVNHADIALLKAKTLGKNKIIVFE